MSDALIYNYQYRLYMLIIISIIRDDATTKLLFLTGFHSEISYSSMFDGSPPIHTVYTGPQYIVIKPST